MDAGAYGGRLGDYMGIEAPPTISANLMGSAEFAVTRLQLPKRPEPAPIKIDRENAFLIMMLRDHLPSNPYWVDGRSVTLEPRNRGQFNLLDLHHNHDAEVAAAVDCIALYLPKAALDALLDEQQMGRVRTLRGDPGKAHDDPIVWNLCESLTSALEHPEQVNPLFVEHVGMALALHMIDRYGELTPQVVPRLGGLAPWQERLATEMLLASSAGRVTLVELAKACRLSRSHFARAFKVTTGVAPHQWLLIERIRRAKRLLASSSLSIEQIADDCGFADQSHFTRAFGRAVRTTPARWRRARCW
jgi:AraC family transcriptional regulator